LRGQHRPAVEEETVVGNAADDRWITDTQRLVEPHRRLRARPDGESRGRELDGRQGAATHLGSIVDEARAQLARLAELGIDLEQVCAQLTEEGLELFSAALRNLLHRTKTTAIIGAIQGVTRPENLRMVNLLDLQVEVVDRHALGKRFADVVDIEERHTNLS